MNNTERARGEAANSSLKRILSRHSLKTLDDREQLVCIPAGRLSDIAAYADEGWRRYDEIEGLVDTPHTDDWFESVKLEAAHQIRRFPAAHDKGKEPSDWFWLIGYLAGKALASAIRGDVEKTKHHVITTAAVLLNWFRHIQGEATIAPGTDQQERQ